MPSEDLAVNRNGIGLLTCLSLVTATMVGTGVYTSLGFQLMTLQSGFSILCLWALGGLLSLCGALSYAELSARIPRSGGEYTYLAEIYHPALGFMAGFVSLVAGFAAPIALSAMAFGTYLHAAWPGCPERAAPMVAVVLISLGHLQSLKMSSRVQNVTTGVKFLLLGSFLLIGVWSAVSSPGSLKTLMPAQGSLGELLNPSGGIALLFVLYAYSGWNATTYLAGEVRDRQKIVGLSLILGTLVVTILYVLINAVFLTSAPASDLRGVLNVGSIAANHLIGPLGGSVMSGLVAIGLLASISAMIWAGPRVTQRIGEDHFLFRKLALTSTNGTPRRATLLQLVLVLGLLSSGSFEAILVCSQIPLLICLILGVSGVIVMRLKNRLPLPSLEANPVFSCPLYPLPPLLFILCSTAGLGYTALSKPQFAIAGVGIMIIPLALYPWISRCRAPRP
ncbi:MAG: amino acid permease [Verrucomicrobia bacterium]|nr:amino acid permease [Verrucomicrobiota bacterium]